MSATARIELPDFSLVALVGASGSGKTTLARRHFGASEVLSSDAFRALVCDDENSLEASADAFETLHFVAAKRLANRRLTVVDATNVQSHARRPLLELAKEYHALPVAIVLDLPPEICRQRNAARTDRTLPEAALARQQTQLRRSLKKLKGEGFRRVWVLRDADEVEAVQVERQRLWPDRRDEAGPFDIIGDVHGCAAELDALLDRLGYGTDRDAAVPPAGRRAVFLGDLVDRGPQAPEVLQRVMDMVEAGAALCVPGNHDMRLLRALQGRKVQRTYGLAETLEQLEAWPEAFKKQAADFIDGLVSHYVLDGGRLVVAHAGMRQDMAGRASGAVRNFALYGEVTGRQDADGLPVRGDWAAQYRGEAHVVYGHTPVGRAEWVNRTLNIDTGCVFGGALTALRYPEMELVSVPALKAYAEPLRPLQAVEAQTAGQGGDDGLALEDVTGRRTIETGLAGRVTVGAEQSAAALEVMSRFAVDPRWLIYLPPTMSPGGSSCREGFLEHPDEALAYYREAGVGRVLCQEKHMGSRLIAVLGRDAAAVAARFGVEGPAVGMCYTRTGRRFFTDPGLEDAFLRRLAAAVGRAGLWEELASDWLALDAELVPWSAKAMDLIRRQYAAVGAAARGHLSAAVEALEQAGADELAARYRGRAQRAAAYAAAYRPYCWQVDGLDGLQLAPFQILAAEGQVHAQRGHDWHRARLQRLCTADAGLLRLTASIEVDTGDKDGLTAAVEWWTERTAAGGEGMVVKPLDPGTDPRLQPALKCRGREYLRLIYGPEYTEAAALERLRQRGLKGKRALALREHALGIEALQRFVDRQTLRQVHECVFAVLALESEPVDPRL